MSNRVRLVGLLFVVTLLLAGCLGGGTTTQTEAHTETISDDEMPNATELRVEALDAMGNVSAYTAEQNATTVRQVEDGNVTATLDIEYAINRSTRSLVAHRTETDGGIALSVDRYVVEQTLYQHSKQFESQYGSNWIKQDISESFDGQWHLYDQLWRYQFVLNNASLSSVETETVDGTEAYALEATVDLEELNTALREALDLPPGTVAAIDANTSVRATFLIDPDTHRPMSVTRQVQGTQTYKGQTVDFERELTTQLTYGNVSVTLPVGAEDATVVGTE